MDPQQFRDFVVEMLIKHPNVTADERRLLQASDLQLLAAAVGQITYRLAAGAQRLVVELDANGQDPVITADGPLQIALLRTGMDLQELDEDEIFELPDRGVQATAERAGVRRDPAVDPRLVSEAFAALDAHIASSNAWRRAGAHSDREFRIEWGAGYRPTAPQQHPLTWFNRGNGFDEEDVQMLLALEVGHAYTAGGPTDTVTITRLT